MVDIEARLEYGFRSTEIPGGNMSMNTEYPRVDRDKVDTGRYEIWHDAEYDEYYVYGARSSGDPRVCPSIGMAREVATSI